MLKQLLIGFFCLSGSFLGQVQTGHGRISVNESLTKIHIAGDAISPNLVIENPDSSTPAHVRVELVDPIDMVRSSAYLPWPVVLPAESTRAMGLPMMEKLVTRYSPRRHGGTEKIF